MRERGERRSGGGGEGEGEGEHECGPKCWRSLNWVVPEVSSSLSFMGMWCMKLSYFGSGYLSLNFHLLKRKTVNKWNACQLLCPELRISVWLFFLSFSLLDCFWSLLAVPQPDLIPSTPNQKDLSRVKFNHQLTGVSIAPLTADVPLRDWRSTHQVETFYPLHASPSKWKNNANYL